MKPVKKRKSTRLDLVKTKAETGIVTGTILNRRGIDTRGEGAGRAVFRKERVFIGIAQK